jgi:hypothetical protein
MSKPVIIYDDSYNANQDVKNIIGNKSFGQIIYKKHTLKEIYLENIKNTINDFYYCELNHIDQIDEFMDCLKKHEESQLFIHIYSNFIIKDKDEFSILISKYKYIKQNYFIKQNKLAFLMFYSYEEYIKFLKYCKQKKTNQIMPSSINITGIDSNALFDISTESQFIKFHSNTFESRFFNSVKSNEFTVLKTSTNKEKIYKEYTFYNLLPESMKYWFVMPFNYKEEEKISSYEMERLHMVDIGIRWIHKAIEEQEFEQILNKSFKFIDERCKKTIDATLYKQLEQDLYINKLDERINDFKQLEFYTKMDHYIKNGTCYNSIDDIIIEYKNLFNKINKNKVKDKIMVIGHGDLCFSNMLYNKQVDMLRLIDPKGAKAEQELWTNPYYDIAKLSHSICGLYDFINNGLFDIQLDDKLQLKLVIDQDMILYKNIFKKYLNKNNIDYNMIRIYEASLFLSMLPLHAENDKKVLGFILNAINIMNEVKECLKI